MRSALSRFWRWLSGVDSIWGVAERIAFVVTPTGGVFAVIGGIFASRLDAGLILGGIAWLAFSGFLLILRYRNARLYPAQAWPMLGSQVEAVVHFRNLGKSSDFSIELTFGEHEEAEPNTEYRGVGCWKEGDAASLQIGFSQVRTILIGESKDIDPFTGRKRQVSIFVYTAKGRKPILQKEYLFGPWYPEFFCHMRIIAEPSMREALVATFRLTGKHDGGLAIEEWVDRTKIIESRIKRMFSKP